MPATQHALILKSVLRFRPYHPTDLQACLSIFDGNTPTFFHASERREYERFLEQERHEFADALPYFVLESEARIVACGGVSLNWLLEPNSSRTAGLTWGMVARDSHGQGWGRKNLEQRLHWLRVHHPETQAVILDTTPAVQGFFERFGFQALKRIPDGYGPGIDRVDMRLELRIEREIERP